MTRPAKKDPPGRSEAMRFVEKVAKIDASNVFMEDPDIYRCLTRLIKKARRIRNKFRKKEDVK